MRTSPLLRTAAVRLFCVLALTVNMAALAMFILAGAAGNFADFPSIFVLAVGSGSVLANAESLDCAT